MISGQEIQNNHGVRQHKVTLFNRDGQSKVLIPAFLGLALTHVIVIIFPIQLIGKIGFIQRNIYTDTCCRLHTEIQLNSTIQHRNLRQGNLKRAVVKILFFYPVYWLIRSRLFSGNLRGNRRDLHRSFQHFLSIANKPEADRVIRKLLFNAVYLYNLLFVFIVM